MEGRVVSFGDDGWGVIRDVQGAEHPFHCTAIADGSRRVAAGADVTFDLVPGRQGRWEGGSVTPR